MKKLFLLVVFLFTFFSMNSQIHNKKNKVTEVETDQWKIEHYEVNRDSAYSNPRIAITKLIGGNRRFQEGKSIRPRQDYETILKLEKGQQPFATIVGCSDSRVPNEMIFDQGFGDLFIVRTAGQVCAAASYGSIEYATLFLKTKLIVVMGHTECGAVNAALQRPENPPGHIVTLVNEIKPAVAKSSHLPGNRLNNAVRQNVLDQVSALRDLEPVLSRKYEKGEILIVGAVYDIHTGKVEFLEETLLNLPQKPVSFEVKTDKNEVEIKKTNAVKANDH